MLWKGRSKIKGTENVLEGGLQFQIRRTEKHVSRESMVVRKVSICTWAAGTAFAKVLGTCRKTIWLEGRV